MSSQTPKPREFDWAIGASLPAVLSIGFGAGTFGAPWLFGQSWAAFYGPSVVEQVLMLVSGLVTLGIGGAAALGIWVRGAPLRLTNEGIHQVPAIGLRTFIAWHDVSVVAIYPTYTNTFGAGRWHLSVGGGWLRAGRPVPKEKLPGLWCISQIDATKDELIAAIMPFLADRPGQVVPQPTDAGRLQKWVPYYRWEASGR